MLGVANVVIPAGSELIGMWGGEWDMQSECFVRRFHRRLIRHHSDGSLLISTFIPFEGTDGEDSTALSVGEMITKVQGLQQEINAERIAQAKRDGTEPELLPPCQHLWTVSGVSCQPIEIYSLCLLADKSITGIYPSRTRKICGYSNQKESFCAC